jgi:hypothetical protein
VNEQGMLRNKPSSVSEPRDSSTPGGMSLTQSFGRKQKLLNCRGVSPPVLKS